MVAIIDQFWYLFASDLFDKLLVLNFIYNFLKSNFFFKKEEEYFSTFSIKKEKEKEKSYNLMQKNILTLCLF